MNILFLMGTYPNFGGVEVVSTVLANEFCQRGHNVALVSFEQPKLEKEPMALDERVKFYPLSKPVLSNANCRKLHNILLNNDVDFIINQWVVPWYVARLCEKAMRGTKCKMIGVHHNLPNTNHKIEKLRIAIRDNTGNCILDRIKLSLVTFISRISLRYTISKCTRYITLSPSFIPIAQRFTWMKQSDKFDALANPLTIEPYHNEPLSKNNEIVYVGRIEYNQKCNYRIVDIWEKLEKKHPEWCLKIVGDGPDKENLQKRIERKRLQNITIEGFQNPLSYYRTAKIILLTSAYEGFGLVLIEGMEYGVVPLSYDSYAAVHDIIDEGVNGYILPQPYTDEGFITRIEDLIQNEGKLLKFSKAARTKAKEFSLDCIVKKWEQLMMELKRKQ